ncbi:MAG TPA: thioredoxin family protein [Flavobacterium sp.]|nr:thioredoxin family protein [Flavobacterium sp.]
MKSIYQTARENSMSYNDYLRLIDEMIAQNRSTGHEQNELLTDFTKLNRTRMNRLDKTQELLPEAIQAAKNITEKQIWLILTESWCGDAAQNIPVLKKLADENPLIDLRLVLRDDNDELMQEYLTNGGRSIPKLIAISEDLERELFVWGPRPKEALELVQNLKEQFGGITDEVKTAIQLWYNKDKGISVQREMIALL